MADEPTPAPPAKRAGKGGPGGPGRLPLLTLALQADFIKALEIGDSARNVCALLGIPETTYFRWMQNGEATGRQPYRGFWEAIQKARPKWRHNLIKTAISATQGSSKTTTTYAPDGTVAKVEVERGAPDGRLALRLLALHAPEEFSEKHILEHRHTGAGGIGPVLIGDAVRVAQAVATMSPAQLRALTGTGTDDLAPEEEGDGGEG